MPITIAIVYEDYRQKLSEGRLDLGGAPCPDASCRASRGGMPLVLSRSRVRRGLVLLMGDDHGELITTHVVVIIALARCIPCRELRRPRLLVDDHREARLSRDREMAFGHPVLLAETFLPDRSPPTQK